MKRNFRLTRDAEQELFAIARYIENDNPQAASRFLDVFEHACEMLSDLPEMGNLPKIHHPLLREARMWPLQDFKKYLVFYRPIEEGKIEILHIIHGARDIPSLFEQWQGEDAGEQKAA
jgi:plasmid stabilization system protein ParE